MRTTVAYQMTVPWTAALALLALFHFGGCVNQEYLHGLGQSAAKGAMQGVSEGIPSIQEPLRQTLHSTLVDDETLRRASRDMTESALKVLETRLASPEMRKQVDALVAQAMESLNRDGNDTVRALVQTAGTQLEQQMRQVAVDSIKVATTNLAEAIEQKVSPAAQRLAQDMGTHLVESLVAGLKGPMQAQLVQTGRDMSQALLRGAAQGADDPMNQASFGGLTHQVMLQAMRGAREGMREGLPNETQVALIAGVIVLGAMLVLSAGGLTYFWWRYQQSAKTLTIVAESINQHQSGALKETIQKNAHDNYVGPWFSSFLKRRGL
jgi:hypothetical protein